MKQHKSFANTNKKTLFHRAIRKYGFNNFEWEILAYCPIELLGVLETIYIDLLKTKRPLGYNSTDGGDGPKGQTMSIESRTKMSISRKGHEVTIETREKIRIGHLGKKKKNGEACRKRMLKNPPSKQCIQKMLNGWNKKFRDHPELIKRGAEHGKAKAVRCVETGEIFDTIVKAAQWCGAMEQSISRCCRGLRKHTKGYSWEYVRSI